MDVETEAQGRDLEPAPSDCTAPRLPVLCTASREMGAPIFGKCKITEGNKQESNTLVPAPSTKHLRNILSACLFICPTHSPKNSRQLIRCMHNKIEKEIKQAKPEKHKLKPVLRNGGVVN